MNNEFDIRDGTLCSYSGNGEHVIVPESVIEISGDAFADNKMLRVIEIPATVKRIDAWLFFGCDSLENVIINKNSPYMTKEGDCIYSRDKSVLLMYPPYLRAKTFEIPLFVKEIGRTAFYESNVEKVICNKGLKVIDEEAFYCCYEIKEIVLSDTVEEIGKDAFFNCNKLTSVKVPKDTVIHFN